MICGHLGVRYNWEPLVDVISLEGSKDEHDDIDGDPEAAADAPEADDGDCDEHHQGHVVGQEAVGGEPPQEEPGLEAAVGPCLGGDRGVPRGEVLELVAGEGGVVHLRQGYNLLYLCRKVCCTCTGFSPAHSYSRYLLWKLSEHCNVLISVYPSCYLESRYSQLARCSLQVCESNG